ncbi:hypothetical protein Tco_1039110 [Tanacetum coccineum]
MMGPPVYPPATGNYQKSYGTAEQKERSLSSLLNAASLHISETKPINAQKRSNKPRNKKKQKWSTLGEPSGKWDYYVRYDVTYPTTSIEEVAATGWGDEFEDEADKAQTPITKFRVCEQDNTDSSESEWENPFATKHGGNQDNNESYSDLITLYSYPSLHGPYEVCTNEHLYTIIDLHIKGINQRNPEFISFYGKHSSFNFVFLPFVIFKPLTFMKFVNNSRASSGTTSLFMKHDDAPVSIMAFVLKNGQFGISNSTVTL